MIGQTRLKTQISHQVELGRYPAFTIYVGPKGCGKRTLIKEIFNSVVNVSTTVDGIRDMITSAYTSALDVTYLMANADNLSPSAYNAMLKIVEEPPKFARFILTCTNLQNIPDTIRSRAVTYIFDPYTFDELCEFCEEQDIEFTQFMADISETPGDILALKEYEGFEDFIYLVIDNIASVSGANAFKISDKVNIKGTEDSKYSLELFFRAFSAICVKFMKDYDSNNCLKFGKAANITENTLADLNIKSVNSQMLFDKWLLDIRSEWM